MDDCLATIDMSRKWGRYVSLFVGGGWVLIQHNVEQVEAYLRIY